MHDGPAGAVEPAARGARPLRLRVLVADGDFDHGLLRLAARPVGRPAATGARAAGPRAFGPGAAACAARHGFFGEPLDAVQPGPAAPGGAGRRPCGRGTTRLRAARRVPGPSGTSRRYDVL